MTEKPDTPDILAGASDPLPKVLGPPREREVFPIKFGEVADFDFRPNVLPSSPEEARVADLIPEEEYVDPKDLSVMVLADSSDSNPSELLEKTAPVKKDSTPDKGVKSGVQTS